MAKNGQKSDFLLKSVPQNDPCDPQWVPFTLEYFLKVSKIIAIEIQDNTKPKDLNNFIFFLLSRYSNTLSKIFILNFFIETIEGINNPIFDF